MIYDLFSSALVKPHYREASKSEIINPKSEITLWNTY